MNITDGIYTDFRKLEQGIKLYMKISQPIAYATLKLVQFLARSVKEKYFSQDMVENFAKFMKTTNGEFSIYRMPYVSTITRENAIENAQNYLDNAGIKYCVMDSVNDKDNALHISVAREDEQKFNVMFTDYLKEQLSGGEKNADDLVNLTDGKTTIISIPDASLDIMKNALTEVNVNFAELPDLVPDDGEKQLRIASADLNVTKQCYEAYRRSLMKNEPEEAAAEMKVFSEDDYTDGAKETTEQYMKNSASDELKEKLQRYEKFDADEMERELMKWDTVIKDSKGFECQALRSNMAYSEISIDWKTLINDNPINNQMERKFPKFIFATIPGTQGQQIVMLPKNQVFKVENEERYIAFVNNQKKVRAYNINGNKLEFDPGETYPTGKDLLKKFDVKETNPERTAKAMAETTENVTPDIPIPKEAPVK
jgi:hypothetical protein